MSTYTHVGMGHRKPNMGFNCLPKTNNEFHYHDLTYKTLDIQPICDFLRARSFNTAQGSIPTGFTTLRGHESTYKSNKGICDSALIKIGGPYILIVNQVQISLPRSEFNSLSEHAVMLMRPFLVLYIIVYWAWTVCPRH